MTSQIIKEKIPNELLFELLESLCVKYNKYYIFNLNSYKKGIFNKNIEAFIEKCKPNYFFTKRKKYLECKLTYNSFITVLRQICNFNKLIYTSKIKYENSSYNINYFIYFT